MSAVRVETKSGGYTLTLPVLERRMLGAVWTLNAPGPNGYVADVEAVCVGALAEVVRRSGGFLDSVIDRDDVLRHLFGEAVVLHQNYDPSKRHGSGSFSGYLYDRLRYRMLDYCRKVIRDAERIEPANGSDDDEAGDRRSGAGDGSHGAPGEVAGDRGDPGVDALRRLLESGDRTLLREVAALGLSAPPGARGRTAQARQALNRLDRARRKRVAEVEAASELVAA